VQEQLNGTGFVIFGHRVNILGVSKVKLVDSHTLDSRVIYDDRALEQKLTKKHPKVVLHSGKTTIFIYEEMDQPRLQRHHYLLIKLECMVVHAHNVETFNDPTEPPKKSRQGGCYGNNKSKMYRR
jgi:hypothetical protein